MIDIKLSHNPPEHSLDSDFHTVPDNTCNGTCSGCGECCLRMTLRLTNKEISTIRKYIKTHAIKPCKHVPKNLPILPNNKPSLFVDMICPFFDMDAEKGHNCTIYPVRPIICKTYTCRMYSDATAAKQVYNGVIAACHGEYAANVLISSRERNLQQLFFPDEYIPQPYDLVVMNEVYHDGYNKYKGAVFAATALQRTASNGTKEIYIIAGFDGTKQLPPIWYPIDGLTVIQKASENHD